jgi:DNA polymerase III alpha subunit
VRQFGYELDVIGRLGFEGYFLAVAQVVADVRARAMLKTCGSAPDWTRRAYLPG